MVFLKTGGDIKNISYLIIYLIIHIASFKLSDQQNNWMNK